MALQLELTACHGLIECRDGRSADHAFIVEDLHHGIEGPGVDRFRHEQQAAGPQHPVNLGKCIGHDGHRHMVQGLEHGHAVQRGVGKAQPLGTALLEAHTGGGSSLTQQAQLPFIHIHAHDMGRLTLSCDPPRHGACAAADVQHLLAREVDAVAQQLELVFDVERQGPGKILSHADECLCPLRA